MLHTSRLFYGFITFFASFWLVFAAQAASHTATTEHASLELLADIESGYASIELTLEDHWHIYWKNPGDSGLDAQLNWSLPEGITAGEIMWLPPKRIEYSGLYNYGYEGTTALTVPLTAASTASTATGSLKVNIEFLICKDICIPQAASLELPLADAKHGERIAQWRAKLPQTFTGHAEYDFVQNNVHFGIDLSDTDIDLQRIYKGWFYPLDDLTISNAYEQEWRLDGNMLVIAAGAEGGNKPNPFHGMLEVGTTDGQKHYFNLAANYNPINGEASTTADAGSSTDEQAPSKASNVSTSLLAAILSAFLGGIILNAMPCVLPVLSLKALSIAKKSDASRRSLHMQGLAYTAGVVLSFLAVAGTLIVLQQAGASIGWGFQLQSAGFVSILIYILFLVGLNLSGMFELPSSMAGMGSKLTAKDGPSGSFFTGVLATVVATPCTAPFMATAIGFALSQPPYVALLVFTALGMGLAFPFLLITFVPGATKLLPRPGAWMERFKQFLAFPIYGTVIWLLWVLTQQTGSLGLLGALIGLLIIGFGLWLLPLLRRRGLQFITIALAVFGLFYVTETRMAANVPSSNMAEHEAYSPELLARYRAEGKAIFVDATAAWCITCKVNERVALSDASVQAAFAENNIHFLVADWTNQDADITAYLKSFGRSGVPLYVYYPKDGGEPELLPQLLTPSIVLDVINP